MEHLLQIRAVSTGPKKMLLLAAGWSNELQAEHSPTIPMDTARRDLPALPTTPASGSPALGVGAHRCCPKVTAVTQGPQLAPHGHRSHPGATAGTPKSQLSPRTGCHPGLTAATPRSPLPPSAHIWHRALTSGTPLSHLAPCSHIWHPALTAAPASVPGWLRQLCPSDA